LSQRHCKSRAAVRKRVSIPQYAPYRRSNSSGTKDVLGNCMKRGCEPETPSMWFDEIGVGEDVFDIEFPVVDEAPGDSA